MPMGKQHILTTFTKAELLRELDLPSETHLLLAGLVTSNDYVRNIPYFGLGRNCDIVREMDLDGIEPLGPVEMNSARAASFGPVIEEYIRRVDAANSSLKDKTKSKGKASQHSDPCDPSEPSAASKSCKQWAQVEVDANHYCHAITAFVERTETPMEGPEHPADISPAAHDIIKEVFKALQRPAPPERRHLPLEPCPGPAPHSSSGLTRDVSTEPNSDIKPMPASHGHDLRYGNHLKGRRSRKELERRRIRMRKHFAQKRSDSICNKWTMSSFKSRTDLHHRHVVRNVDLLSARLVDPAELKKMTPTVPRPRTKHAEPTPEQTKSAKVVKKKSTSKGKKGRKQRSPTARLKKAFSKSFAMSTQTIGCLQGCMARALLPGSELSRDDIRQLTSRLNKAMKVMNSARIYVLKMVELIVYGDLLSTSAGPSNTPSDSVMVSSTSSDSVMVSNSQDSDIESVSVAELDDELESPLDLLLTKATGTLILRNLFALALNGKVGGGRPAKKAGSIQGRQVAETAYARLLEVLPNFEPVNKEGIPLSIVQEDAADDLATILRTHFHKLPSSICGRTTKAGCHKDDVSVIDAAEEPPEDEPVDPVPDEDDDMEEETTKFAPGHVRKWWGHYQTLPQEGRPAFLPKSKFTDAFIRFQERALPPILWTKSRNPAHKAAEKIMSKRAADELVAGHFGSLIKESVLVRQTSYGKKTTTMEELSSQNPEVFGMLALDRFLDEKFKFIAHVQDCRERGQPTTIPPPPLPPNQDPRSRYVLSNILVTNGKRLHITVFDTTKPYRSRNSISPIYRIEKAFPTPESIQKAFNKPATEVHVVGVDPGEKNTAAFCRVVRAVSTSNSRDQVVVEAEGAAAAGAGARSNDKTGSANSAMVKEQVLGPSVEANNLVISRSSLYAPTLAYRQKMETLKAQRVRVNPGVPIDGSIWANHNTRQDAKTGLPTIYDLEGLLAPGSYRNIDEMETALQRFHRVEPILHDFYASEKIKKWDWEHNKAKRAEMDWAISAVLRDCRQPTLFAYGNGTFRTGINLTAKHESYKRQFAAVAEGHVVVLVDEKYTSAMCPRCAEAGIATRMAKPTMRSCVCLVCGVWLNRDSSGSHNIAT
ncbi:hypothetical protein BGZ75_000360, partial [Mortierella antarctica]